MCTKSIGELGAPSSLYVAYMQRDRAHMLLLRAPEPTRSCHALRMATGPQ